MGKIRWPLAGPLLIAGCLTLACSNSGTTQKPSAEGAPSGGNGGSETQGDGDGDLSVDFTPPDYGYAGTTPEGAIETLRFTDGTSEYDALGRNLGDGPDLTPLVGYNQFWFAWSVFNHDSEVFGHEERIGTAPFEESAECAVPCEEIRLGCPGIDCIPAITDPVFVSPNDPRAAYVSPSSYVVGVAVGDDVRAYPHNVLWWHEVVNDVVGGEPIAVTHCPLTFSTIGHDRTAFGSGDLIELGVSGRLFNSNLVFYDRNDESFFSQLLGKGTTGAQLGSPAPRVHVWEMTWAAWRTLHPTTVVLSGDNDDTGHARDYQRYPYGQYFVNHEDTFSITNPAPSGPYRNKALTYGLRVGGDAKAYAHQELADYAAEQDGAGHPPRASSTMS